MKKLYFHKNFQSYNLAFYILNDFDSYLFNLRLLLVIENKRSRSLYQT